jgi:hypothetical protein
VPERAYYPLADATADEPAVAAFTAWLLRQTDASPKD